MFYHLDHDTPVRCIPTCLEGDEEPKYPEIKYLDCKLLAAATLPPTLELLAWPLLSFGL